MDFNFLYKYEVLSNKFVNYWEVANRRSDDPWYLKIFHNVGDRWPIWTYILSNSPIDSPNLSFVESWNITVSCNYDYGVWNTYSDCSYSIITDSSSNNIITSEQVSWMWTALAQWGSSLLKIWIQIMPYAIAMTIILILFALVKNRSRLKTNRQLKRLHRIKTRKERQEISRYRNRH